ncbi:MAG: PTS system mannose/fructose/sorbose family transporter subunit IID [Deltaproteobacteria bacterium]|nr:PTS system mannose/fructose/sorbose family transporter subunit IID [Deltaproteobacteria bacterium]
MKGVGFRVFLRSFLIEIMWNYPRMQNIGFTFCLLPALDRLMSEEAIKREAVNRQLESGNTNPALAPMCIGAVTRVEEWELSEKTPLIKKRLMSTLAAQGDRIFWGVLRPASSLLGVSIAMTSLSYFWAPFVALLIYNVPNLVIRYMGFDAGWHDGVHVVRRFKSRWVEDSVTFLRWLVFLCSGSLTAVALILAAEHAKANDVENFVGLGLFVLVVFFTCFLILKKSFSQTRIIYPLLIVMLVGFSLLQRWT